MTDHPDKQAVLLVNLGSPASFETGDVRNYLDEFLSDPRMLDMPGAVRFLLVKGLILPLRAKRLACRYREIWLPGGAPLMIHSRRMREHLQDRVGLKVGLAMRYGAPSIFQALADFSSMGVGKVLLIPLLPHYASSTYESVVERVKVVLAEGGWRMEVRAQPPYFDHPAYIAALAAAAREELDRGYDHLIFSFHGLPERHLRKTDPTHRHCLTVERCCEIPHPCHATCYRAQTLATARCFAASVGIPAEKWSVAFQSKFGPGRWLGPALDDELLRLAAGGVQRLVVMSPSFVTDCLETLHELDVEARQFFLRAGGKEFVRVPCLNTHPAWVETLKIFVEDQIRA
ncbi:MAG: ferrochelatase [Verrucomicrobiae bacterium]|nr:ferrochelatase [Verrucomicrobiae bacterium]